MVSKAPNLSDPLQVAVEVTEVKGTLAMLQSQVSTGMGNVSTQLAALQGDVRELSKVTSEVARHQQAMEAHSEGLNRAFVSIERLANEFSGWRKEHEEDNCVVADRVTTFKGVLIGFGLLGSLVVGMATWGVMSVIERADENLAAYQRSQQAEMLRLQTQLERAQAELRELREARTLR